MPRKRKSKSKEVPYKHLPIDTTINRIGECETVINELDSSHLWAIVQNDLEIQKQNLDDNWQNITDPERLQKARELKFATMHILSLKKKYQEELDQLKNDLTVYQNPDKIIPKDYDMETKTE